MKKGFGSVIIGVITLLLTIFTSIHTFHFISMTVPADQQIFAFAALAALDGGMFGWAFAYMSHGLGGVQRILAITMVVIDFLGVGATTIADTLYNTGIMGITYQMTENDLRSSLIMVTVIILGNVAAAIAYHMFDPEQMKRSALNDVMAHTHDATIKTLKAEIPAAAERLARRTADSILMAHSNEIIMEADALDERTRKLASTRKPRSLPAQPAPMDYEEQETIREQFGQLPVNPTPGRNGRSKH